MYLRQRTAISVALGVATTMLVAWWPGLQAQRVAQRFHSTEAAFIPIAPHTTDTWLSGWVWGVSRTTDRLYTEVSVYWIPTDTEGDIEGQQAKFFSLSTELERDVRALPLGKIHDSDEFIHWGYQSKHVLGWYGTGWPMRALSYRCTHDSHEEKPFSYPGAVVLLKSGQRQEPHFVFGLGSYTKVRPPLILPFKPIWPGFAVNTLLAAALWWILLAGIRMFISHDRRWRGLCKRCRYDRRGIAAELPCPECGTAAR